MHVFKRSRKLKKLAGFGLSATATAALAGAVLAPPADAGTYTVWTCRAPDGSPAGTQSDGSGWAPHLQNTSPLGGNTVVDECGRGGSLTAALGASDTTKQPTPSWILWSFTAPVGTAIRRYELDLDAYSRPLPPYGQALGDVVISNSSQTDPVYDERWQGFGEVSRRIVRHDPPNVSRVSVVASCTSNGASTCSADGAGAPARFKIYRGTFDLEDRDAPLVTSVSGDAVSNAVWNGPTGISVAASDVGSGVYRMAVEIDGEVKSWINLGEAPCRAWPGTERTFTSPKPCPASVSGIRTVDAGALPEGNHTIRFIVEDASGNQTTAFGPVTRAISHDDPGPLNGTPAAEKAQISASWDASERTEKTVGFGARPTVRGRLSTERGGPIAGASVRVSYLPDVRNPQQVALDPVKTKDDGTFRYQVPPGAGSRTIQFEYHRRVNDKAIVAQKSVSLKVRAAARLKLNKKVASKGDKVKITGSLLGRPLPVVKKVVELQAKVPRGKWITFKTLRTTSKGKFKAWYKFRQPGPAKYLMRVRVRKSGDYAFATGTSKSKSIRVR